MRKHRVGVATAVLVCAGSVSVPIAAHANSTSTFYVNNAASASCSDSTTDSSTTPYCTIQAAVDAATSPGDTVTVSSGVYAPFKVTASGTAAAPITIEGTPSAIFTVRPTRVVATAADDEPAATVDGASYVSIENLLFAEGASQSAVDVTSSTHVTVDSDDALSEATKTTAPVLSVASDSSSVTLSRNFVEPWAAMPGISVQGGSGNVVTTNYVVASGESTGIVLSGTTASDVTSNTLSRTCGAAIDVADGSTATSIENNYVPYIFGDPALGCGVADDSDFVLRVDKTSTADTVADYNTLITESTSLPNIYSWGGTTYATSAAFASATGQGTHDSTQNINSANSDAPGELSTDIRDNPRVNDPEVADTGAGTYTYYDRGAIQLEDPITLSNAANWPTKAPVGGTGTYTTTATDQWGNTVTGCTYDFGDGTASVTVTPSTDDTCSTQHAYATAGQYDIVLTVSLSDGYDLVDRANAVNVVAAATFTPKLVVSDDGSLGVSAIATAPTDDWSVATCTFDFGDGSAPITNDDCDRSHTYTSSGTRTITVTITDAGGNQESVSQSFTTSGSYFTPITPARVLDTRDGTGVSASGPVAADGVVKLKVAGVDGLPATGVTAVALNVTATEAMKIGYITAYPDGGTLPNVSNVDFKANQNVANTVIVEVGSDGYVDLANESSGTTDIVADLEGYYSTSGTSGYTAVSQVRLLDTRKTVPVAAGSTVKLSMSAYSGISAAVLNLTVVDATGNGYVTASPDGGAEPATSNLNYLAGQTVANEVVVAVGSDGDIDFTNSGKGQADLIVDLSGYFTSGSGEAFTPLAPLRYLDTRDGVGAVVGGYPDEAGADQTIDLEVADICPAGTCVSTELMPADAAAVAANVTVASPTANGYITVYPGGVSTVPNASVINFLAGQQPQNAVTVGLGSSRGDFNLYNASKGDTQLIVDVFGYYGG